MKPELTLKYLFYTRDKKNRTEGGFGSSSQHIEKLFITIIIGVLVAIALPNLLSEIGKARENEESIKLNFTNSFFLNAKLR